MRKATSEEWRRFYEAGARNREAVGGDYIRLYQERKLANERLAFLGATTVLALMLVAFYVLLAR